MPFSDEELYLPVTWDSRWKQIKEYPNYWISQYGQIFNLRQRTLVPVYRGDNGEWCVRFTDVPRLTFGAPRYISTLLAKYWSPDEQEA